MGLIFLGVILYFILRGLSRVDQQHWGDFRHFYWAAEAMRIGNNPYLSGEPPRCGYIYPPLIAYLYVPLSNLTMPSAAKVCVFLNLAALLVALIFLALAVLKALRAKVDLFAVSLLTAITFLISFDKIKGELQMFQTNGYILLAFAAAIYSLRRFPMLAGLALGFAFNIKYLVAAILPYLALRRYFRAAIWMAAGILLFAFLPAQLVGFPNETNYLARASSGVLSLFGIHMETKGASIEPIDAGLSISITSSVARIQRDHNISTNPIYISAAIFILWTGLVLYLYRREKISVFATRPSYLMTVIELISLLAVTLCFSPQTNTRHTVLTAAIVTLSAALFLYGKLGRFKWFLAFGILVMLLGLDLPPGNREDAVATTSMTHWHYFGGPMWCTLFATTFLIWAGLKQENADRILTPVVSLIPVEIQQPAAA